MLNWAKREVKIACEKENPNKKDGEFDYGCACYESALKAFETLCDDGHSGLSIKITQSILNRLIDGKPLTPIEDTDDVWNLIENHEDGYIYHTSANACIHYLKMSTLMEPLNTMTLTDHIALIFTIQITNILQDLLEGSLLPCFL